MKLLINSLILSTLLITTSFAQGRGGEGRRTNTEAIKACQSADVGSPCSFAGRNGDQMNGTCTQKDSDKPLVCKSDKKRR